MKEYKKIIQIAISIRGISVEKLWGICIIKNT